ncbi:hypothetical protein OJF2_01750 [Aquisphaera giovannonii]|uniref:DarT domain-containing protein n=1 Tax=Aquisphaera giovannonii TaxID=406548 RepID=A0A5B9VVH6_9BACT|nr:DUF4433 domain-containing protein [Aquisphaera giovannonii]QEH31710.1 hypothetical protein OJF2_01750 [Aquisphaera giovannonii]
MPTLIHHITNIDNLARIVQTGGLWCDAERVRQRFECVGIAHESLKQRRGRTAVRDRTGRAIAAGGVLADYVPFYFANRSPMLYSIHRGNVVGYAGGQENVVYLVSTVETAVAGDRAWCFTDGHAVEAMTEFLIGAEHLNKIDWDTVRAWKWYNTPEDPDRKRRKQAEFLIHGSVPWTWIHRIGVVDQGRSQRVREIIAGAAHQPEVTIEPDWYY